MTSHALSWLARCASALAILAPALASAQAAPMSRVPPSLVEVWALAADSSRFRAPKSIAVAGECHVWLADPLNGVWRVPCEGGPAERIGGVGSGPDDFGYPVIAARFASDTVAIYDRAAQQLFYFAATGEFARARPVVVSESVFGRVQGTAPANAGGALLAWTVKLPNPADKHERSYIVSIGADGVVRDSVLAMGAPQSIMYEASFAAGRFDAPLQRRPFVVFLGDTGLVLGFNDRETVSVYDTLGGIRRLITLPIPEPGAVARTDREAYADSIKRGAEREMDALQYDLSLRTRYRVEVDRILAELVYPAERQHFDMLAVDERSGALWVLLPGRNVSYARTWLVCTFTDMSICRTVRVPHKGAVVSVAIFGGALYAIERALDRDPRVAKYAAQ